MYKGTFQAIAIFATFAILLIFGTGLTPHAAAQDNPDAPDDSAVLAIFEKHCAECHGGDDEYPDLHKDIDLKALIADEDCITPGEPDDSSVYFRVDLPDDNRKRMPKSKGKPGDKGYRAPLSDAEKATLRRWIQGDQPGPPPPPVLNPEQQVLALLQNRCAKCHTDDNAPDLHGGINLADLLRDDEFITPGDPANSLLYKSVIRRPDSRSRMPKNVKQPGETGYIPPLSRAEQALFHDWITRAKAPASAPRDRIDARDHLRLIATDLDRLELASARHARYLSLANLYNLRAPDGSPAENDAQMNIYRAALGKLVNSLSKGPVPVPLTAVDPARTLFRLDLRDYAIRPATWETIARAYPHGLTGIHGRSETAIRAATGSTRAYLRGDWFVFACAQPPLYHDILQLPTSDRLLERELGIDVPANL